MEQIIATRSELLARRSRLELAIRGRALLEKKRNQLMDEFRQVAGLVLRGEDALSGAAGVARRALAAAEAGDGPEAVRSAGMAGREHVSIETGTTTVMGVRIPEIQPQPFGRSRAERGYGLATTTPRIDLAAERFETELELLLELATRELRLRRLVDEIATATRRVNALEFVVIPQVRSEAARIQATLDERERQDRFRLKRIRQRTSSRVAS